MIQDETETIKTSRRCHRSTSDPTSPRETRINLNRTGRLQEVRVNRTCENVSSTRWTGVRVRTLQNLLYPYGERETVRVSDELGASGLVWGVLERSRSCSESSQR